MITHENGLITKKAAEVLNDLAHELEETFESVQVHRTRTEMEVSVLNEIQHPTPASKYWQALREQNAMLQGVTLLSFDYREAMVRADILLQKLTDEKDELKCKLLKIKWERKLYLIKDMKRAAKAKIREIKDWSEIKTREARSMTDAELQDVGNHQLVSYTRRWVNQVVEGGLNGSTAERNNLLGQLKSGIKMCESKGMLVSLLSDYEPDIRKKLITMAREA